MSEGFAPAPSPSSRGAGDGWRPGPAFRAVLALWLTLVAPLVAFAGYHEYGLLRPELVVLYGVLAGVAVLGGAAIVLFGDWARVAVLATGVTLFLDLQFDFGKALVAIGLCVLACCWLLRRHLARILVTAMAGVIAATLALPASSAHRAPVRNDFAPSSTDLPVIVHLVLDEHIGIEGIPIEIGIGQELKESLVEFYLGHGFRLYGGAYSRYMNSYNAIPNLLNFTAETTDGHYADPREQPLVIGDNAWFRALADRGARIHVYQSDYMELCEVAGVELAACISRSIRTMKVLESAPVALFGKVWVISSMYVGRSAAYRHFRGLYGRLQKAGLRLPDWTWEREVIGALGADGLLGVLIDDVAAARPGDVFLAHVMLPHFPYMLDRECRLRPSVADWLDRNDPALRGGAYENSVASRNERYALYLDQVECTRRRVGELLAAMRTAGILDGAVILIHGDHGSRIGRTKANAAGRERLTAADYSDYFSTLYAVRSPGQAAGYEAEPRALDQLFLEAVRDLGIPAADPDTPAGVLLDEALFEPMILGPVPGLAAD